MCVGRSGRRESDFVRNLLYSKNECNSNPLLYPKVTPSEMIKNMVIIVKLVASGVAHDTPRKRQKSVSVANRRLEKNGVMMSFMIHTQQI